jgi:hypothetical protein
MTHHIEEREIRGISPRTIRWFISMTVIICASIGANYYGIQHRLDGFDTQNRLQDLKIETINIQLSTLQTELKTLQIKQETQTITLEQIKARVGLPQ